METANCEKKVNNNLKEISSKVNTFTINLFSTCDVTYDRPSTGNGTGGGRGFFCFFFFVLGGWASNGQDSLPYKKEKLKIYPASSTQGLLGDKGRFRMLQPFLGYQLPNFIH